MSNPFPDSHVLTAEEIAEAEAAQAARADLAPYKFMGLSDLVEIPLGPVPGDDC